MTDEAIFGTWDDKHYLWDATRDGEEPLRVQGVDQAARAEAIRWLDRQLRRRLVQRTYQWGPFGQSTWAHEDDEDVSWSDIQGSPLARLPDPRLVEERDSGFLATP